MFGTTATTAWELEAERRVELAQRSRHAIRPKGFDGRKSGFIGSLRRWTGSLGHAPWPGLKDVRT
jgi:hypothetical protein